LPCRLVVPQNIRLQYQNGGRDDDDDGDPNAATSDASLLVGIDERRRRVIALLVVVVVVDGASAATTTVPTHVRSRWRIRRPLRIRFGLGGRRNDEGGNIRPTDDFFLLFLFLFLLLQSIVCFGLRDVAAAGGRRGATMFDGVRRSRGIDVGSG
jgi:hypothetical protein